jgi:hypothetical protein
MSALLRLSIASIAIAAASDPFHFLQPSIRFSEADRRDLQERVVVAHMLPAEGRELALMVATSLNAGPDQLLAGVRQIATLETNDLVPQVGRFSARPRLEDLQRLTLDTDDAEDIAKCTAEHCGLRLQPDEIARLHTSPDLSVAFRRIVLQRVEAYLRHGEPEGQQQFANLLHHAPYVESRAPAVARYLARYPAAPPPGVESFLYWSKEKYASKPMIRATHLTILRGLREPDAPEVLVVAREIFSTRYTTGSLATTMLFRNPESPSQHYLVYINRTVIDGFGGLLRPFVEHRIKTQAVRLFAERRDRIEHNGATQAAAR